MSMMEDSSWKMILVGDPQGFISCIILFLIYLNDLIDGIKSICKTIRGDTSLS